MAQWERRLHSISDEYDAESPFSESVEWLNRKTGEIATSIPLLQRKGWVKLDAESDEEDDDDEGPIISWDDHLGWQYDADSVACDHDWIMTEKVCNTCGSIDSDDWVKTVDDDCDHDWEDRHGYCDKCEEVWEYDAESFGADMGQGKSNSGKCSSCNTHAQLDDCTKCGNPTCMSCTSSNANNGKIQFGKEIMEFLCPSCVKDRPQIVFGGGGKELKEGDEGYEWGLKYHRAEGMSSVVCDVGLGAAIGVAGAWLTGWWKV